VDRSLKKAKAAGGTIYLEGHDVPNAGRMAILSDPTGAAFALWEARGSIGTQLKQLPGTVCWHDLSTPDRVGAAKFYSKVFGWKLQIQDFSGNPYYLLKLAGKRGGLGGIWPQPLPKHPPAWFTYWVVKDAKKTATQAKRLGGKVILGPITVPDTCTFAIIEDPQGAAFGALQPLI
jgi:predicted enzyme related to lactoylglutathione lyase